LFCPLLLNSGSKRGNEGLFRKEAPSVYGFLRLREENVAKEVKEIKQYAIGIKGG